MYWLEPLTVVSEVFKINLEGVSEQPVCIQRPFLRFAYWILYMRILNQPTKINLMEKKYTVCISPFSKRRGSLLILLRMQDVFEFLCQAIRRGSCTRLPIFFFSLREKTADVLCEIISKFSSYRWREAIFFGRKIGMEQNSYYIVVSKFK